MIIFSEEQSQARRTTTPDRNPPIGTQHRKLLIKSRNKSKQKDLCQKLLGEKKLSKSVFDYFMTSVEKLFYAASLGQNEKKIRYIIYI